VGAPGTAPRGRLIRPLARPLIVAGDHHAGPPRRPRSLSAALLDRLDRPGAAVPRCAPLAPPQPQEGHSSLSPKWRGIALSVAGARCSQVHRRGAVDAVLLLKIVSPAEPEQ